MKKIVKKPLSLSSHTVRPLESTNGVAGGHAPTVQYSTCFTCNRAGCTETTSMIITFVC